MISQVSLETLETLPKKEQILQTQTLLKRVYDLCDTTPGMGEEFLYDEFRQNIFYSYVKVGCLLMAKVLDIQPTCLCKAWGRENRFTYNDHDEVNTMFSNLREEAFLRSGWTMDYAIFYADAIRDSMASCEYGSMQEVIMALLQDDLDIKQFPMGEPLDNICDGVENILSETDMNEGDIMVMTFKNERLGKLMSYAEEHDLVGTRDYQDLKKLLVGALCPIEFYDGMFGDFVEDGCFYAYQIMFNNHEWNELYTCEVSEIEPSTILDVPLLELKMNELIERWKVC